MAGPDKAESARVSSYLLAQGEKHSWLELWPRVVKGRLDFLDAIAGVSEEQAAFHPQAGDWSIQEVAQHVLTSSQAVAGLIEALVAGKAGPDVANADRARELASASLAELRRELLRGSVDFSAIGTRFPDDASLEPTAPHPFFGPLHCRAWFLFQRVHDQDHARQVQAIKQAAGYPG
ncbi:MAG: DinB family protein [Chloroflexi bacterium]|nr:DinB family protein [Chloroflexota bacterium]